MVYWRALGMVREAAGEQKQKVGEAKEEEEVEGRS
jgi:hypothetical protein